MSNHTLTSTINVTDQEAIWNFYVTEGLVAGRTGYATNEETTAKLKVYALSKTLTQGCKSDREKVKAIHDWQAQCCMANQYVRAMLQHSNTLWMYWGLSVR